MFALALCAGLALAPAAMAATGTAQAATDGGYARLVFSFDRMPTVKTHVSNGILVIEFAAPVQVPVERLAASLGDYVSGVRADPDGRAIRVALDQRLTVNTVQAGERLFVDLLPTAWKGPPPGLPSSVIEELTAKAREAERLQREEEARIARAKPRPITIRAARQPTFTRLTFQLGGAVPVRLERDEDAVSLIFDAPFQVDLRMLKAQLPARLDGIDAETKDARLAVKLQLGDGIDVRTFWDGDDYVADLSGTAPPRNADLPAALQTMGAQRPAGDGATTLPAPAQPNRPAGAPETVPAAPPAAGHAPDAHGAPHASAQPHEAEATDFADSQRPANAPAASPAAPPAKPAAEDHADASPPAHPAPAAASGPPAADVATTAPPAEAPPAGPAAPPVVRPAQPTGPLHPVVSVAGQTVRIAFPFDKTTPSAVYRRGDNLWIVFDTDRAIDADALAAANKDLIASADVGAADGAVILRLKLKASPLVTSTPDGLGWIVSIGNDILGGTAPVGLRRLTDGGGRSTVVAALPGIGHVHRIDDRDVGDTIFVVTAAPPARGFLKSQSFVEFRTLVTAHGLAFLPGSDDVVVTAGLDTVTVSRDGGLTVTSEDRTKAPQMAKPPRGLMIDTAQWAQDLEAPHVARERTLLETAADAPDSGRVAARLALARFYVAKGLGAEAAAVLDVAATDKKATREPEYGMLKVASRVLMGRDDEANAALTDQGIGATAEAGLWRGLAELGLRHYEAASAAFQQGEPAMALYPPDMQAKFRLGAYAAALEVGNAPEALTARQALDALEDAPHTEQRNLLDARFAELTRHDEEALAQYEKVAAGKDAIAAAEARLRGAMLSRRLGKLDEKGILDQLEILAATWRGDDIEAQTLQALSDEYLKAGQDRKAFDAMELALRRYPKSAATRDLQNRMQQRFADLFLEGGADKMAPVDALALFYDYQTLTPADRRGDEMIRKLADRLVDVDLLDQAADLLQHQIDNRLIGAGRAQVAAKLAMVHLMNRKPSQALQVLSATRMPDLPKALATARLVLEARALAETARPGLALEILDQIDGPDVERIKADVLWQSRRWGEAAAALETQLGDSWQSAEPLTDSQRTATLRMAIAYSLADDKIGLDRVRAKFTAKMADSIDAASFETVTAPIDARGSTFTEIAKQIAASDTLDTFLSDYRKHYLTPLSTPPAPKPSAAADAARPSAG